MPIVITANLRLGNALQGIARLQRYLATATQQANALTAALQQAGAAAGGLAANMGSARGSRGSSPARSPRPPAFNPFQNNPQAGMAYFARQAAMGNAFAARQYGRYSGQYNSLRRNQANAQNYLGFGGASNPQAALFAQAIASTRFGRGGGQVLGHVATALSGSSSGTQFLQHLMGAGPAGGGGGGVGIGGAAGSFIGGALGGAAGSAIGQVIGQLIEKTVGLFVDMAKRGLAAMNEWNVALARGGGSVGQARSSNAIGNALGVDGSSIGAGIEGYGAAMIGLNPNSSPFGGDTNYSARFIRLLRKIRGARNDEEGRRIALINNHPELARVRGYSNETFEALTNQPGGGFQKNAALFGGGQSRLSLAFDNLVATLSGPAIKGISNTLGNLAYVLEQFNKALTFILEHLPKAVQDAIGYDPAQETRKSMDRLRGAVDENTQAINEGTFGGGRRAAGATPRGLSPSINPGYANAGFGVL